MKLNRLKPRKAINKAFLKVKPNRTEINDFKTNLIEILDTTNNAKNEEFHKNLVRDFLKKTYYDPNHFINIKKDIDLVIHNGNKSESSVGVIIETKSPTNKNEMVTTEKLNAKAFQELVLYYLRERIELNNLEVKHLIITNTNEWFIFDATLFDRLFAQNKTFVTQFNKFKGEQLADSTTDFFYKQIAEPFIADIKSEMEYTYFNLQDYQELVRNKDKKEDKKLIALFKLLSPEHLLKLPFANDSNSLDKRFYNELLHIIGLTEIKQGSKKLIERNKEGERNSRSLLEDAIIQLDSLDKINQLKCPSQFGNTQQEILFNVGLELVITWVNRILFLKLLESQLITYHKGDKSYSFLNLDKIKSYGDLNRLFFQVLAKKHNERNQDVKGLFEKVPYLNSSLFDPMDIEHSTLSINYLTDDKTMPIMSSTVLKDEKGKKRTGNLITLEYLFEFLNTYDFSSEGSEEIQEEDNKTLINASVLGLIFEKINGYKDGSFFTPGFITMYMCRETIRKAMVQKFNETKGWSCKTLDDLYDKIEDKKEANDIINSLKICDPAVGSGHFLVSALNEIVAIKSDLKILQDRNGRRLKEYHVEVVNDELIVADEESDLFEYKPNSKDSQRVQETLFHEKQTIIENCLFGVDINPNSVKICRLRLWIELLKNAYYKNKTELETLPNLETKFIVANSLLPLGKIGVEVGETIGMFDDKIKKLQDDLAKVRHDYFTAKTLATKRKYREQDQTLKEKMLEQLKKQSGITPTVENSMKKVVNWDLYNQNAVADWFDPEWMFGVKEGFDIVLGNPPYIRQESIKEFKPQFKQTYQVFTGAADIYTYFYEKGFNLLSKNGHLCYITSNKWMRANYGQKLRHFFKHQTQLKQIIDFEGKQIFENATVDTNILLCGKQTNTSATFNYQKQLPDENNPLFTMAVDDLSQNAYTLQSPEILALKNKIEQIGTPLKEWDINIYRGVLTGYNEAFIIDTAKRNELIAKDPKSAKIIRPILRGRDIKAYEANWAGLWIINSHNGYKKTPAVNINKYPAVKTHLDQYYPQLETRQDQGGTPYNLRSCAYLAEFEKEKIMFSKASKETVFYLDNKNYFIDVTGYILSGNNLKFLVSILNSNVLKILFYKFYSGGGIDGEMTIFALNKFPIPKISEVAQQSFIDLVDKILIVKAQNQDTAALETEIDKMVYQLYNLTQDEINTIEESTK